MQNCKSETLNLEGVHKCKDASHSQEKYKKKKNNSSPKIGAVTVIKGEKHNSY